MPTKALPTGGIGFEVDCQGSHAVPVETETPYTILDAKEASSPKAFYENGQDDTAKPLPFEQGARLMLWAANFLSDGRTVQALAIRALLIVLAVKREPSQAEIAKRVGVSRAAVRKHAVALEKEIGCRAILPGQRSEQTRILCRQARQARNKAKK